MISLVAAIGQNNELGKDNQLLWHLKEDLQYFKNLTLNHKVVMGLNTYLSIGKPLPSRENIVLTTHPDKVQHNEVKIYNNILDLIEKENKNDEEIFIIGGAKVYSEFLKYADRLYLTEILDNNNQADVYFPIFNEKEWHKKIIKESSEGNIKFQFVIYERLK